MQHTLNVKIVGSNPTESAKFIGISHNGIAADFESAVFLDIEGSNPSIPSTHAGGQHGVEAAFQAVAKA